MDIRCDRCQTEYELEDENVSAAGAQVQCTTCGYTFLVSRTGRMAPVAPATDEPGPSAADSVLMTEDGQVHRFREISTLHKWIVERKVTRDDRVSYRGGPWYVIGDLEDLRVFFDVVDQADRARAEGSDGPRPVTPPGSRRVSPGAQPAAPSARPRAGFDTPRGARRRVPSLPDPEPSSPSLRLDPELDAPPTDLLAPRRWPKTAGLVAVVVLAGAAGYVGFSRPQWMPFFGKSAAPPSFQVVSASPPTTPGGAGAPALAPPAAQPATARAPSSLPPAAAPTPVGGPPTVTSPVPAAPLPPLPAAAQGTAAAAAPSAAPAPGGARARSYDQLVAEADRLLEHGHTAKAERLYTEALSVQPNGTAAVTGLGYTLLDRHKNLAAIDAFKRALASSGSYPAAVFGLAEAYRAQGEAAHAVEQYRRYLTVAPSGPDAPAARRQVQELEAAAPAPAAQAPPRRAPEAAPAEPAAPPASEAPGGAAEEQPAAQAATP